MCWFAHATKGIPLLSYDASNTVSQHAKDKEIEPDLWSSVNKEVGITEAIVDVENAMWMATAVTVSDRPGHLNG